MIPVWETVVAQDWKKMIDYISYYAAMFHKHMWSAYVTYIVAFIAIWTVSQIIRTILTEIRMHRLFTTLDDLNERIGQLQVKMTKLDVFDERMREFDMRLQCITSSSSVIPNIPSVAAAPPPPPPPPPAPKEPVDPLALLKLRKQSHVIDKTATAVAALEKKKESIGMSDVLNELSKVQRKVMVMISSPRSKYLDKKKDLRLSSLHREYVQATSPSEETRGRESKRTRTEKDEKNELEQSPTRMMTRSMRRKSSGSGIPVLKASSQENPFKENTKPQRTMDPEALKKELPHVRLRKTDVPRSPGGTTLIPRRSNSQGASVVTWADSIEHSLKQKFSNAPVSSDDEPLSSPGRFLI